MKVAIVDLGTNTFHLMLAEIKDQKHSIFYRERFPVKIGEKGISKGIITPPAWNRALNTLKDFKKTIDLHQIDKIFGTATSAIRSASNGRQLVEEIRVQTGIEIEIISGIREAELIYLGAKSAIDFGNEISLVMDIGGGSIEFILADNSEAHWMHSFEIGGQRMVERFHKSDPIGSDEIKSMHRYFEKELSPLFNATREYTPITLVGCSGTFDTISEIYCAQHAIGVSKDSTELPLTMMAYQDIAKEIIDKKREERLRIPGMIEMRVEMIVVACVLINFLIDKLSLKKIRVSSYALKEGILLNVLKQLQSN